MQADQFDSFVEDFISERLERAIVIIGSSRIDELLFLILDKYLIAPIEAKNDELLNGDRPLSTFSSRIRAVYRLGIVDRRLYKVLDQVRIVRNLCAHRVEFDVMKSPVKEHLLEIKKELTSRETYKLSVLRYFNGKSVSPIDELHGLFIAIFVILEAVLMKVEKTTGVSEALSISRR